jgi:hypothetical protein
MSFVCFEVGEGIEKKEENFADKVMAQVEPTKKILQANKTLRC